MPSRSGRHRKLVAPIAVALTLTSLGGCGAPGSKSAPRAASWQRIEDGWAKTVPLDPPLVLEGARPGDALEAVVMPSAPGTLVVESEAGTERLAIETTRRVLVPLAQGGRATVRFEGATATLHDPGLARGGSRAAPPRRVLLVVIDTLRADAVSETGTPELLAALAGGARFTSAWSTATWTLPATASLFTGKAPTELALPDGTLVALALGEPTIASDFAARGFHTACISANYTVNHENGFSSGCELFLAPAVLGHGEWPDADWALDRARRVLEWFPDRDLFLYVHLMDPHDPYLDHETGESLAAPSTGQAVDAAAADRLRAAYASEVRHVSARLAAFLHEAGAFERVVVTADHGEEFLEHGGWRHGPTVYPEVSRVPLLLLGRGVEPGEIDRPVSLLDLRRWLASDRATPAEAFIHPADVVSFVHAAPRFAAVGDAGEAVLFARDLAHRAVVDAIGDWLRAHRPPLELVDAAGASREPTADEAASAALRLVSRFRGLAAGQWLWVPPAVARLRVEVEGASGGWWWGGAGRVELATAVDPSRAPGADADAHAGRATLEVESPSPFALVFVPAAGGGRLSVLEGELDSIQGSPTAAPSGRAVAWRDPGRAVAALDGVEETMRRLRAQGYL